MDTIKLIATYTRVSTARQEEEQTIRTQDGVLKEEAQKKNYTKVREYADEGWSGDTLARPALDQLRADARAKLFEAVLIYDPDRLARRYSYQELIMDELREAGIEIIFVTIASPKNSEDKILHGVRGLFAEYERAKISERFRLGKVRKVKEGHLLVSEPLYGYSYIPKQNDRHGYYVINEAEAKNIRLIFSWIGNEGLTMRKVIRRLQELDIQPRKSKRGVWSTSTLTTILRNKAYIGHAHWGSSYATVPLNPINKEKYKKNKKSSRRLRPENEWYSIPVPAIIEAELFQKVRQQLETNYALCQRNTKNEYLLGKKIWCVCGNRRSGEGSLHGKHLYYRCSERVLSFPLVGSCHEKGINARIADTLVWDKVRELMSSPELMQQQISRLLSNTVNTVDATASDIDTIKREIEKLKTEEDRYNKAYGAGVFTVEKLNEYTSPILERLKNLQSQILKIQSVNSQVCDRVMPNDQTILTFAEITRATLKNLNFQAKREIVINVIEKVVGNKESLKVVGNIPFPSNLNVEYKTIHRNSQDTNRLLEDRGNISIPFEFCIKLPNKTNL